MAESINNLEEVIITNAQTYFEQVISAIDQAKHQVLLESYIFGEDYIGQAISQALENAALRGVNVKVMVDGVGAGRNFEQIAKQLTNCGAEVRVYRPLPWRFELWPFSLVPDRGLLKLWYLLSYMNQRNHRKIVLIDKQQAFLGSFNITLDHLPVKAGGKGFSDTAIHINGFPNQNLQVAFDAIWSKYSKHATVRRLSNTPYLFNFTRALRQKHRTKLLQRIDCAQNTIWISNAYFLPDSKLLKSLINAGLRGIDVRLMLPGRPDIFFIPWASSQFFSQLLDAGVRLYEYEQGVLHSKTMIIDDWACIGSSNLNTRSLIHDLELDYSLQLTTSREGLAHIFLADISKSIELKPGYLDKRRFLRRQLGRLLMFCLSFWV